MKKVFLFLMFIPASCFCVDYTVSNAEVVRDGDSYFHVTFLVNSTYNLATKQMLNTTPKLEAKLIVENTISEWHSKKANANVVEIESLLEGKTWTVSVE